MLKLLNPHFFNNLFSAKFLGSLSFIALCTTILGLYQALILSPIDYQQGNMVRIMYVHVPAAWMSLGIYSFMAICSLANLIWQTKMSFLIAASSAHLGTSFALITLVTGCLWGKPIWGTWWVWDARLTSMLILFLLYVSYITVLNSSDNIMRAEKPASVICLVGFINIPIVKFSVNIWHNLHQPASVLTLNGPTIHTSMLMPLFLMFISFIMYFLINLILKIKYVTHMVSKRKYS
jgi:heme exporter protein C